MISEAQVRQIELALWPQGDATPGSQWAVLDCARNKRIYRELQVSRLDHQCLYSGDIPTELRVVSPHIVELSPRYGFTRTLLSQAWGQGWGIFVRINDGTRLRHHLRKLLTVKTEDGRRWLFRYFDPRVLTAYLPTCTPDEIQQFFGPITSISMEDRSAAHGIRQFDFIDGRLSSRVVPLQTVPGDS